MGFRPQVCVRQRHALVAVVLVGGGEFDDSYESSPFRRKQKRPARTPGVDESRLDRAIGKLGRDIERLPAVARAAFFATCGEALIPLYERFHLRTGWGEPRLLRAALDAAWRWVELDEEIDDASLLDQLADLAPHGDDFDAPPSTEAQDAVICVDVAVRHAAGLAVDPGVVHYAVEPWIVRPDDGGLAMALETLDRVVAELNRGRADREALLPLIEDVSLPPE